MKRKDSTVTIFVPVKNAEATIERCIESLLKQTYKNRKIFVIDNMSTDRTYTILKQFKDRIHLERMSGPVPRMHNYILKKVSTDFIAYTNADCVVDKNWLKNLLSGFTSEDIVATAGYFGTPKDIGKLQLLIGREMEERFKNFPEFIKRAPDANLCVKTDVAKKVMFDEKFFWSWESDFGFRLTQKGKMRYIPEAVIYHYHRSTWKGFFKQQFNNAMIKPLLYWKHRDKVKGDHISTPTMGLSLLLGYVLIFLMILTFFNRVFLVSMMLSIILLLFIWLKDILRIAKSLNDVPWLFGIFICRTIAWIAGIPIGIFFLVKNK